MAQATTLTQLWDKSMQIGHGFTDREGQVLRSAVEDFDVVETYNAPEVEYREKEIISSEDSSSDFRTDVEACGAIFGVGLKAKYDQHQSVECSSKSMTKILRCIVTSDIAQYPRNGAPGLTAAASELLSNDAAKFRAQHGDYFIAGYCSRAILEARYIFRSQSHKAAQAFSSSLTAGKGFVKGHLGVDYLTNAESAGLECRVEWHSVGIATANLDTHPTRETVQRIFDNFKASVKPRPYTALLHHYSMIDPRATRSPYDRDIAELKQAVLDSFKLEKDCRMSEMMSVRTQILPDVSQVVRGVLDLRLSDGWLTELTRKRSQVASLRQALKPWQAREALLVQADNNAKHGMYRSVMPIMPAKRL